MTQAAIGIVSSGTSGGTLTRDLSSAFTYLELYKLGAEYVVSPEREYNKDVKEITGQGADIVESLLNKLSEIARCNRHILLKQFYFYIYKFSFLWRMFID